MFNETNKDKLASNLNHDAHNAVDDLHNVAHKAGCKIRNMYDAATTEISDDFGIVTSKIRKSPVQSSLLALGAGLVLGVLLRRS